MARVRSGLGRSLDAWAKGAVATNRFPCLSLSISMDGKPLHAGCYGWADVKARVPLGGKDIFRAYSQTKLVTSIAAMQLYEQGRWKLDDHVASYIPAYARLPGVKVGEEVVPLRRAVTLRDILTHTSGISYAIMTHIHDGSANPVVQEFVDSGYHSAASLEGVVDAVATVPLVSQPGEAWNYGMNIDVMGRIVEIISGSALDAYADKHILGPLGMRSTHFRQNRTPESTARLVKAYQYDGTGEAPSYSEGYTYGDAHFDEFGLLSKSAIEPGGGLDTTIDDWMALCECLRQGGQAPGGERILRRQTVELMTKNHLPPGMCPNVSLVGEKPERDPAWGHGLGVACVVDPEAGGGRVGHAGTFQWGGMASTVYWVDRRAALSVVALSSNLTYALKEPIYSELKDIVYRHVHLE